VDLRVRPRVPHALRSGKKTVSVPNETELFRVQKQLFRVQKELFRVQKETRPAQGNKSCGMREKRPKVLEKRDLRH